MLSSEYTAVNQGTMWITPGPVENAGVRIAAFDHEDWVFGLRA
jgi:hypothetical protein